MNNHLTAILLALGIGVFGLAGTFAAQSNAQHDAEFQHKLVRLSVKPEPVEAVFEGVRPSILEYYSAGKVKSTRYDWGVFETRDWVFLSKRIMQRTCPVLKDFAQFNGPQQSFTPQQLEILAVALKGKSATVQAHVPRFNGRPDALEKCLGYGYDSERRLMTLGGKAIAMFAESQPGLALTAAPSPD